MGILHNESMPFSQVAIIHQTIMIWLKKFKFHWKIFKFSYVKWSGYNLFSVLIHKSVENYMGQMSLFVERSGSVVCLIL